ncbi:CRISPR-associated endonuclease Cas2 [Vibrio mexicanus]|uniref:CRISPR-associated endonuclease Cas2 n=1 Tax=Vibrio mexicanus TaxID=1004326 RepID=UPI0009495691|nr:CRISPR-associated endonuclease Cas2 [Vibrio mexicanus]
MIWIISFDISDNKKRRRAVKVLEGYGHRTQFSVFECLVRRQQLRQIQTKLKKLIEPSDKVLYYPVCGKDALCRYADGNGEVYWPEVLHIVDG